MNIKQSMGRRLKGHAEETELNLTAVMNIFLILIPFLLLTAVFVRIAVLELSLPSLDSAGRTAQAQKQKSTVINILVINETGFELKSPDIKLSKLDKQNDYDWNGLKNQLTTIKEKYPESEDIIISPVSTIKYHTIISVMDRCRESGFPNISISG
ncbi:biopolymer transporter ExbD [candidate division KSB1 bacterium]|nr:biopolymer transporter ExbD [candidate division KSB1 bacterium]